MKMKNAPINMRVRKHRNTLRMSGLRPIQIWVPDTRQPGFAEECRKQSQLVAQIDSTDASMQHLMSNALEDLDGWVA